MKTNKYSISWNDSIIQELQEDEEFSREYLNGALENYLETGNFNYLYKGLERVIKARGSVSQFAREANLDRTNLYAIFNNKKKPQLETIAKILNQLGYSLKIA
jgi:probable addiction module antidote protein